MAWHRPVYKPLSEAMMVSLQMHICVTRPQCVNAVLQHPRISDMNTVFNTFSATLTRVGNGYDQAQLRSIKMADAEHGEYRLSRIVSTRHLLRRPYCAWRESWDQLIFWMWETAAARSDIADIWMRKFRRIGRNCHALLIVTAYQSRRLLIVTCLNES